MSKKLISLLLAIMLTVSMAAVAAVSVSAETNEDNQYVPASNVETQRVYLMMPTDWNTDCSTGAGIYWWEGTDSCPSWYGYNAYEGDSENVYYCDIPTDVVTILWNNGYDGGDDPEDPDYAKAMQTNNQSVEGYDVGDTDLYPDGTDPDKLCDGMIFVINPEWVSENSLSGKKQYAGSWFYYYGDGKYGYYEDESEAAAKGVVFTDNTTTVCDRSGESDVEVTTSPDSTTGTEETTVETTTVADTTAAEETEASTEATTELVLDENAYLTVNATSNLFGSAVAQYNENTDEVTVSYYFKSDKNVENIQYVLTYDNEVFEAPTDYSSDLFGEDGVINLAGDGYVKYNASNVVNGGYAAADDTMVASFTFKVKDISALAPVKTTFDLQVVSMLVADYQSGAVIDGTQEHVVYSSEVDSDTYAANNVSTSTVLPASTFEPTEPATTTEPVTATTEPATTTEPVTDRIVVATSNFAPESRQVCVLGDKIAVKYYIDPDKDVLATQWKLTYDETVLSLVSCEMPQITSGEMYNFNVTGEVKGDASNLDLYAMDGSQPFVTAVFEVLNGDPGETYVDLDLEFLVTANKAAEGNVDESSVSYDVKNSEIYGNLTASSEVTIIEEEPTTVEPTEEPTTAEPTEEPTTAEPTEEPTTAEPTEEPTTAEPTEEPTTAEPTETTTSSVEETTVTGEEGTTLSDATSATGTTGKSSTSDTTSKTTTTTSSSAVQTGEASMAVIILCVLIAATGVMFVVRKREMLD